MHKDVRADETWQSRTALPRLCPWESALQKAASRSHRITAYPRHHFSARSCWDQTASPPTTSGERPAEGLRLFASRRKQVAKEGRTHIPRLLCGDNSRDSVIVPTSSTHKPKMWHPFFPQLSHQFYSALVKLVLVPSHTSGTLVPPGQEELPFCCIPALFPRANPQQF